jgi:glycosyltransferase involved in cell wall biosynthesis
MKVLFVAAKKGCGFAPFVEEQAQALRALAVEPAALDAGHLEKVEVVDYAHTAHGIANYMKWVPKLHRAIKEIKPDVVHAHFGLTGLLAGLAAIGTGVPVVVTYHGCDINDKKLRPFSRMAMRLAAWNIFVSKRQMVNAYGSEARAAKAKKCGVMACGIDIRMFDKSQVDEAWYAEKFGKGDKVLFGGDFERAVKDPQLAKQAIEDLRFKIADLELIEMKGYTREQVVTLMYKCKALLLTSIREGSPQVLKEAMACDCPIVSVDVGDVSERLEGLDGCYVVEDPTDLDAVHLDAARLEKAKRLAEALEKAIAFGRTKGRERLLADGLDNEQVAERLIDIYNSIIKKEK